MVVVSASIGAGHDHVAAELVRRLRGLGYHADCHDFLDAMPWGSGAFIRSAFRMMLRRAAWSYGLIFAMGGRWRGGAALSRLLLRPTHARLRRLIKPHTAAVVSTFPLASQALGSMRQRGDLSAPLITVLTDFAVHALWVAPGVDLHIALHEKSADQAREMGADRVVVSRPAVSPAFGHDSTRSRAEARQRFGLPTSGRLALLITGSWGVGAIRSTAAEIAQTGTAAAVVVCGRNSALCRRLRRDGVDHVLGWVEDMPTLLRAVDLLVENAGGLSSLEAMASGLPLVSYRPLPGHGRANIATMAEAGVTRWVRRPEELRAAMTELFEDVGGPNGMFQVRVASDPAEVVARMAARAKRRPGDWSRRGWRARKRAQTGQAGHARADA